MSIFNSQILKFSLGAGSAAVLLGLFSPAAVAQLPSAEGIPLLDLVAGDEGVFVPDSGAGPVPNPIVGGPCESFSAGFRCNFLDNTPGTENILELFFQNPNDAVISDAFLQYELPGEIGTLNVQLPANSALKFTLEYSAPQGQYQFDFNNNFDFTPEGAENTIPAPVRLDASIVSPLTVGTPPGIADGFYTLDTGLPLPAGSGGVFEQLSFVPGGENVFSVVSGPSVPEPMTILGSLAVMGCGVILKCKNSSNPEK